MIVILLIQFNLLGDLLTGIARLNALLTEQQRRTEKEQTNCNGSEELHGINQAFVLQTNGRNWKVPI